MDTTLTPDFTQWFFLLKKGEKPLPVWSNERVFSPDMAYYMAGYVELEGKS